MSAKSAAEVLELATARGKHIILAESLTGGALSDALVSVPGASSCFLGSVVAYNTELKKSLLGVAESELNASGAVSSAVALQMAHGAQAIAIAATRGEAGAIVALGITGVAGPTEQDGQAVGTVWIAAVHGEVESVRSFHFGGSRADVRSAAVDAALDLLREVIEEPFG